MKKFFASICAIALVVTTAIGFSACSKKTDTGTYKIDSVKIMGLTATQADFKEYEENRDMYDQLYNSLYKVVRALFDISIFVDLNSKTGMFYIQNITDTLANDVRFDFIVKYLNDGDYIKNKTLMAAVVIEEDKTQENAYYVYPIDPNTNQKISFSKIFAGGSPFTLDNIHATIKNGQMAFKLKLSLFDGYDVASGVIFTTTATILMSR